MTTLACPNCGADVPITARRVTAQSISPDPLEQCACPQCGKNLLLFANWSRADTVELSLIDPNVEWSVEEILRQEG